MTKTIKIALPKKTITVKPAKSKPNKRRGYNYV